MPGSNLPTDTSNTTASNIPVPVPFPRLAIWSTNLSNNAVNSISGACAGFASGIVTCPLDVIKTKLQAHGTFKNPELKKPGPSSSAIYRGMIGTARTILAEDGAKGFYRGLGPMLLGYLPTWAVYMTVYNGSKEWYIEHGYGVNTGGKWLTYLYASVTAGACSTIATNPIWVIKTRLMSQVSRSASHGARTPFYYHSTMDAFRKMYRSEGIGAFYSGLAPAMLGLTHVAIQFPLYEYFKQRFTGLEMGETPEKTGKAGKNTVGILGATFLSKVCATTATYPHEVLRTRMQTQQRLNPEAQHDGVSGSHHSESLPKSKRLGNSDGSAYQPKYKGVVLTCRTILKEEGWRAFYNGMGTNMIRAVPAAMTTMLAFESLKSTIGRMQDAGKELREAQANPAK